MLRIIEAVWTPKANLLVIMCDCGNTFQHPTDRWTVRCPKCNSSVNVALLRDEYARDNRPTKKEDTD